MKKKKKNEPVIGDPRPSGEEGPAGDQRAAGEEGPAGDPRPAGAAVLDEQPDEPEQPANDTDKATKPKH